MSDTPKQVAHEYSDVSVRGVLWFAAGLVVFGVVVHVVLVVMFDALAKREDARKASSFPLAVEEREQGRVLPPAPRLEGIEWKRKTRELREPGPGGGDPDDYGWMDEKAGIVRISVEKAMELALAEGRFRARSGKWRGRLDDLPSDASSGRRTWGGGKSP